MRPGGPAGRPDLAGVPNGFDDAAPHYDLMVRLNPGYHRHLRMSAQHLGPPGTRRTPAAARGLRLLDLGCGTGASTAALLRAYPGATVVAVDGSAGMLAAARSKPWPPGVRFVHARAEGLEETLQDQGVAPGFDAVMAAYLVRNVTDRDGVLRGVQAVLRPGARLVVHEYSVADSWSARVRWRAVCRGVVVPLAWLVSGDTSLYRYLQRSVLEFDGVHAFEDRLRRAGFVEVRTVPSTGWQRGILHTFVARTSDGSEPSVPGGPAFSEPP